MPYAIPPSKLTPEKVTAMQCSNYNVPSIRVYFHFDTFLPYCTTYVECNAPCYPFDNKFFFPWNTGKYFNDSTILLVFRQRRLKQ